MLVKLFTQAKGFVEDVELPPFNPPPDVVIWGQRFFKLEGAATSPLLYTECFVFHIPVGMSPTGGPPTHELNG